MNQSSTKDTLKLFIRYWRRYPGRVVGVMFGIPLTVLMNQILPPLIVANVIQKLASGNFTPGHAWDDFGTTLILYTVVMFIGTLGWRFIDAFNWPLESGILRDLAEDIYNHLLSLSANFHANSFTGSLVSASNKLMGAYVRIADTTIYGALPMVWGIVFTSLVLVKRAPIFVLVFNIVVVLYILVAVKVSKPTRIASAKHAEAESRQTGALADSITNVLAIKSYAGQQHEAKRFKTYTKETQQKFRELFHYMRIQLNIFASFTRLLQIVALFAAVISIANHNANFATVFLILNYSGVIADQLFNFNQSSLRNYNRSFGDAGEMTRILQLQPEIEDPTDPEPVVMDKGEIVLDKVTFTHDGNNDPLFKDFSLTVKAGERVGLVGHSGSGKTTLTRLLLRFSDIDSGAILIDGQDLRSVTQDDLHSRITYVPQEPMLFHRSLAENIAYGNRQASHDDIVRVSKLAHSHEFIKDLPKGYDTLVGERGIKLSGGQRQRIAIARAMIKDAPIVLLDEATSALDSESEVLIQKALWTLMEGKTAIVIAHRLSTVQKMDRIVVMDNGKIIEEGSHSELLAAKGKYAELWAHQSGGFIED